MRNGTVDHSALRVNQVFIIALLLLAYLFNQAALVLFVTGVMLVGTIWPKAGLFKLVYGRLLRPAGLVKPDPRADEAAPHLFAQGLGGLVLTGASALLLIGFSLAGWLLVGLVIVLAGLNLFAGFCAGCFVYYQLARRGIHLNLPIWRGV